MFNSCHVLLYEIYVASSTGNTLDAMQELEDSNEDKGFIATRLNQIKHRLLSHSQHLNFFTILVLASSVYFLSCSLIFYQNILPSSWRCNIRSFLGIGWWSYILHHSILVCYLICRVSMFFNLNIRMKNISFYCVFGCYICSFQQFGYAGWIDFEMLHENKDVKWIVSSYLIFHLANRLMI